MNKLQCETLSSVSKNKHQSLIRSMALPGLVEPREVPVDSLLQTVQVPLDALPCLQPINSTTQLSTIHKLAGGLLDPLHVS